MSAPTLTAGSSRHCAFSFNSANRLAANFNIGAMSAEIVRRFATVGITLSSAPAGHSNPEVKIVPLGAPVNRKVIAVDVWATIGPNSVAGGVVNREMAEAFKVASRDGGLSVERIATGLNTCTDLTEWYRTPAARATVGGALLGLGDNDAILATVCASYETFSAGSPPPEAPLTSNRDGLAGIGGRVVANASAKPIEQSTTPGQVGQSPRVEPIGLPMFDLGMSATTFKIIAGCTVALLATVIIGYTARGVSGLIREVK